MLKTTKAYRIKAMNTKKKQVMCFGSFDLFHKGHEYFLKESLKIADHLIIIVARSENIKKNKHKDPLFSENERIETLKNWIQTQSISAEVLLGDKTNFYAHIDTYQPDIICLGYDQKANEEEIHEKYPHIQVKRISSFFPEKFKSSLLKKL